MFSLRLFFHLHNDRLNCTFMKEMEKQSTAEAIRIGLDGKLICGQTDKNVKITNYTVTGNSFKYLPLYLLMLCYYLPINYRNTNKKT